jgi:hypothetical protein
MGVSSAKSRPARSDRSVERRRPVLLGSPTSVWNLRSHTEAPRGPVVVPDESSRPPTNRPPQFSSLRTRDATALASSDHGRSASLPGPPGGAQEVLGRRRPGGGGQTPQPVGSTRRTAGVLARRSKEFDPNWETKPGLSG